MHIGTNGLRYEWLGEWAKLPDSASAQVGWAHPGLAVTDTGQVITCHQSDPTLLVFAPDGSLARTIQTSLTEGHGISVSREGDVEYLWIADSGSKRVPDNQYGNPPTPPQGKVVKMTLNGQIVLTLERPDLEI